MDPRLTSLLAIWGAGLSTIAFCWQIFLWRRSHPSLDVKAEMRESPTGDESDDTVVFEIRNRGGKRTTIEEILFVSHRFRISAFLSKSAQVQYPARQRPATMKLPVVLEPNDVWTGFCYLGPREEKPYQDGWRRRRFEQGRLFYRIRCSHTNRRPFGRVVEESPFADL